MIRIFALMLAFLPLSTYAEQIPKNPAQASLIAETIGYTPGQTLTVALRLQPLPQWHTYWRDPGDAGLPTSIEFTLPSTLKASDILWPKPRVFSDPGGLVGYGYYGDTVLPVEISIPASFNEPVLHIKASANWLVCKNVCVPGSAELTLDLPKASGLSPQAPLFAAVRPSLGQIPNGYKETAAPEGAPMPTVAPVAQSAPSAQAFSNEKPAKAAGSSDTDLAATTAQGGSALTQNQGSIPAAAEAPLFLMLLFALVGGLILNLMPCVLPVLSIKVMSFVRQSHESRRRSMALGGAFSVGVIGSFWVLALIVILARAAGQSVGWGFQFQSPVFVSVMACIVTAFALNLFGVFELYLPGVASQVIGEAGHKEGLTGAFFTGAFMTLLATPCTAPFLATALGFAFSQSSLDLFLIFTAAGIGLAAPYQVLSSFPALMRWVPKPGAWMLYFKQLMGFLLLGTLCWLLWVLGKQTDMECVIWMLAFLMVLGLACWIYGIAAPLGSSWKRFLAVTIVDLLLLVAGYQFFLNGAFKNASTPVTASSDGWLPYSAEVIQADEKQGKTVFVDFTAQWCWTCKVNERVALDNAAVKGAFAKSGIVMMRADWTRGDPAVTAALTAFQRPGVPFYAFYSPKLTSPLTLDEVITPSQVLDAIQKAQ